MRRGYQCNGAGLCNKAVLNRLWLEPRAELVDYADRGAAIFKAHADVPVAALHWGMAVATYPFFVSVASTPS